MLSSAPPYSAAILVVDDKPADVAGLGSALQPLAEITRVADTAAEAIRLAGELELAVAILRLDLDGADGIGVAKALRARIGKPSLPILFVGDSIPEERQLDRVRSLGAADFLPLPQPAEMLRFRLAVLVGTQRESIAAAERAHVEDERKFRLFFALSSAGHALVDPQTMRFIDVNQKYSEMVGRTVDELRRLTFLDITHPDDRAKDRRLFSKFVSGEATEVSSEKRYIKPDGSVIWVHLTTTIVRDERGVPDLQLTVVQDITERKKIETELEESQTRLRLAVEAAELGVFFHDGVTGQDTWNDQFKRLLGLPADAPPSLATFFRHIHPDDRGGVEAVIRKFFEHQTELHEFEIQYRVIWPDGTTHFLINNGVSRWRPTPDGGNRLHIVGTARDITRGKEFEMELRRLVDVRTRELREKADQLENFFYTVAHDLRAPLRAINGYADMVIEELGSSRGSETLDHLDRIRQSTRRLDALIRDLLAYSRMTEVNVELERIELREVVAAALRELDPEITRFGASVSVCESLPAVMGDRALLEQVIVNLLSNALKFSSPDRPPRVEILSEATPQAVRLLVRDNGLGILPEYHERIFKIFERLQVARDHPGTGIGLAIVARAMQRIGGRYGLESQPGSGSTFWIELRPAFP